MQRLFCGLIACLLVALNASAHFELEFGSPLIAQETSGGFVPPELYGWGRVLAIYPDGKVIKSQRENATAAWSHQELATLSPKVVHDLVNTMASLAAGTLVFDENEPECTDLPGTTYSGQNSSGQLIDFAAYRACRLGVLENFFSAHHLVDMMQGLNALSFFETDASN